MDSDARKNYDYPLIFATGDKLGYLFKNVENQLRIGPNVFVFSLLWPVFTHTNCILWANQKQSINGALITNF